MPIGQLDRIRQNPQAEYPCPQALIDDPRLDFEQKSALLQSWEHDAQRLAESAAEGMAGGETSRLKEVAEARLAIAEQIKVQQQQTGDDEVNVPS